MKKRNIPFVVLIVISFVVIVVACSQSQVQKLTTVQTVAQVEQRLERGSAVDALQPATGPEKQAVEHQDEEEHEASEEEHLETVADAHGPQKHVAGGHDVPSEAVALQNPVPATDESITLGAKIYAQNCAVCHGETGEGDGPLASSLAVKPANLHAEHVQVNSDGALFWIITHGKPNSPMPPWDNVLTETERWHVVNFLRTFGEGQLAEEHEEELAAGTSSSEANGEGQLQEDMGREGDTEQTEAPPHEDDGHTHAPGEDDH